jgi:hypothetical protein
MIVYPLRWMHGKASRQSGKTGDLRAGEKCRDVCGNPCSRFFSESHPA